MKLFRCCLVAFVLSSFLAAAQTSPAADPYEPVLDRLQAITTVPLKDWWILQQDLPHGELPPALTGVKITIHTGEKFSTPVWLYQGVKIPQSVSGYSVAGSRVSLNLNIDSNQGILISVFVNGDMVAR